MKIFLHSFSDVITNSSETIYVSATEKSIVAVKEVINYFLQKAGSDKTADDLFTFELELDEAYVERILDDMGSLQKFDLVGESVTNLSTEELEKKEYETIRKLVKEGKINLDNYDNDCSFREDHLLIIPKDNSKEVFDMTLKVSKIFDIEAVRNG
jgi:uncharacterized membrane protein YheB (UPF0754 family)